MSSVSDIRQHNYFNSFFDGSCRILKNISNEYGYKTTAVAISSMLAYTAGYHNLALLMGVGVVLSCSRERCNKLIDKCKKKDEFKVCEKKVKDYAKKIIFSKKGICLGITIGMLYVASFFSSTTQALVKKTALENNSDSNIVANFMYSSMQRTFCFETMLSVLQFINSFNLGKTASILTVDYTLYKVCKKIDYLWGRKYLVRREIIASGVFGATLGYYFNSLPSIGVFSVLMFLYVRYQNMGAEKKSQPIFCRVFPAGTKTYTDGQVNRMLSMVDLEKKKK